MKIKKLKGISLPIEMIIIIAIAVLVLVVVAAFFIGGFSKTGTIGDSEAFGKACQIARSNNCVWAKTTIDGYTPAGGGTVTTETACLKIHTECNQGSLQQGDTIDKCCQRACGCPVQ